jgi:release factor glutamine methyltransferase
MTYRAFWQPLTALYDTREAQAVARLAMEKLFGLSVTDVVLGAVEQIDEERLVLLQKRILTGEPIQYITGTAEFCGHDFHVEPGVLIPRPETQWLCRYVADRWKEQPHKGCILDMGTGSGCIAISIALELAGQQAEVEGWDLSDQAVRIARHNARQLDAEVSIVKQDMLCPPDDENRWDVIVSNPPYVCEQEKKQMEQGVLNYEPNEALFVPDDNPLLYYEAIARYAYKALKASGIVVVEINERFGSETAQLMADMGLRQTTIHKDQFGKERFATAFK